MSILDSYKKLIRVDSILSNHKFDTHIPTPTAGDYMKGYITRYFVQKTNDNTSPIFEVNASTFTSLQTNSLYIAISLKWRITGPKETKYRENGDILDINVAESNRRAILLVYDKIPNLKLYLPNLLQFYK
jgi:hypothetical protein